MFFGSIQPMTPMMGFNAWVRANSRQEAECEIRCEYHSIARVELLRIENA